MFRNLSLFGGLLAVAACFPDLSQYEGEGDDGSTVTSGTTTAGTPTSSSDTTTSTAASTPTSSSSGSDGGGGAGSGAGGDVSSSSSSSGASGGGGGASDPCLPPTDAPGVQPGALVEGELLGTEYRFCIDLAEVTHAQYRTFYNRVEAGEFDLAEHFDAKEACAGWKGTDAEALVPAFNDLLEGDWNATQHPDLPIVSIDYCDASAYCAWAGKRLCGGDEVDWNGPDAESEWFLACSNGQRRVYPYNTDDEYDLGDADAMCNGGSPNGDNCAAYGDGGACRTEKCTGWRGLWEQGESNDCGSFDPRVVNLSGNVAEWTDACSPYDGGGTPPDQGWYCETRGGSCPLEYYTSCYYSGNRGEDDASNRSNYIGFRCCWDAEGG